MENITAQLQELENKKTELDDQILKLRDQEYKTNKQEQALLTGKFFKYESFKHPTMTEYFKVISPYSTSSMQVSVFSFPEKPWVRFMNRKNLYFFTPIDISAGYFELHSFQVKEFHVQNIEEVCTEITEEEYNKAFLIHANKLMNLKFEIDDK